VVIVKSFVKPLPPLPRRAPLPRRRAARCGRYLWAEAKGVARDGLLGRYGSPSWAWLDLLNLAAFLASAALKFLNLRAFAALLAMVPALPAPAPY
jgi:hypothetical protein